MNNEAQIDYSEEELDLRENNPSVKQAWKELMRAAIAYEKYYQQVIKTEPITEYTREKQLRLQELNIKEKEEFNNYAFVLKLAQDY